jgi:hypothetical protein
VSYSFATGLFTLHDREAVRGAVRTAVDAVGLDAMAHACGTDELEIVDHVKAIEVAAGTLCRAVGEPGDSARIRVAGHAEPGHGQRHDWSPETITLAITVERRPVA